MKNFIKNFFTYLPKSIRRLVLSAYEYYFTLKAKKILRISGENFALQTRVPNIKPKILFYHVSGLSFGGTEKFLQILAKYINKQKYDVLFLYSPKPRRETGINNKLDGRIDYLKNENVKLISFDYVSFDEKYPYILRGAKPSIFEVINNEKIDLVISAGSGFTEFPLNLINDIPILMINIFGSFNVQENFIKNICISNEVADKIRSVVPEDKIAIMYIPSGGPTPNASKLGLNIRDKFGIKMSEMVFGRIGRASDDIFDPIGIRAFQKLVKEDASVHYLIMSPMPAIVKIVEEEKITNVHFLPPSSREEDVWAFHQAIDALAHFRSDGESFGLNIAEAMLCGKPIITHRSKIWNAHLEYLSPEFSRVADTNDIEAYYQFMKEFVVFKNSGKLENISRLSKVKADELFLIKNSIGTFEKLVDDALK